MKQLSQDLVTTVVEESLQRHRDSASTLGMTSSAHSRASHLMEMLTTSDSEPAAGAAAVVVAGSTAGNATVVAMTTPSSRMSLVDVSMM